MEGDITKNRNLRWVLFIVGLILLGIGIYMQLTLHELIGKPTKTTIQALGRTTTTTRYWATEEQKDEQKKGTRKGKRLFF